MGCGQIVHQEVSVLFLDLGNLGGGRSVTSGARVHCLPYTSMKGVSPVGDAVLVRYAIRIEVRYSSHISCLSWAYLVSALIRVELKRSTRPLQHGRYAVVFTFLTCRSLQTSWIMAERKFVPLSDSKVPGKPCLVMTRS